jgi:hypothetical protein
MTAKQIAVFIMALIMVSLLGSCATIGEYKPLSPEETLIGTVQTTFVARDSWFTKNETINMQAYIKLLEAAVRKYPENIDIRNILWVTGRKLDGLNIEVTATGNVVEIDTTEG